MVKSCWHFIYLKNNVVKCEERGVIRSWNCKLMNNGAKCLFYTPVEVGTTSTNVSTVNLCEKCSYGQVTFSYGVKVYFCTRKALRMYGKVSKCTLFKDVSKDVSTHEAKTLLDFFNR